jgi:hypothetical protein
VYIRPDLFVIFDRVSSVRETDAKRWYLHTMEEPRVLDGDEVPDRSVHSAGHAIWKGVTGRATHKGSALFWKTLLPRQAVIRKIGGRGHQFEVNGENYDMYDAWYERLGQDFFDRIGLGLWRMEVEPVKKQHHDLFLHVLQATDAGVTAMVPVELLENEGLAGARIQTRDGEVTVTFATTGAVRGHIQIRGGEATVDEDLSEKVADHYEAWQGDPRYARWRDDPHLKAALTP